MKLKVIGTIIVVIVAGGTGVYLFGNKNIDNKESKNTESNVEEFIKQSAAEVNDPQAGLSITKKESNDVSKGELPTICSGNESTNFSCYKSHYKNLAETQGIKAAFADLRERYNTNSHVIAQCHPITHVIGQAAVEKYPTASEAYLHGDSFCWSGYYHGVLEGVMAKIGRENVVAQLNTICANIPGKEKYSFDYYNCVHGLGHGLMAMTETELFESLSLCDNLVGDWEQSSCYGGVYMENVIVDNKNHFTKYLRPNEPLYPCTAVGEKYKAPCYLMQTSYMLKVTGGDFTKVFALCAGAERSWLATCYQSLGRDASGRSSSDISTTKATCLLGTNYTQQSNCIIGAVKDFISYHHSDVQAKKLCESLDNPELEYTCTTTAESYYSTL